MKIVFMGTPEFAVPSLDALIKSGHEIVAIVTAPDALGGRGGKHVIQSAVKQYALSHGLNVLQPVKLRDKSFISRLKALHADLQVVVAFRMLPEVAWNMPPLGTVNVHASLLPKYRGAAPIHWAVINGEKETGVTIFRLKHDIDTGDILAQSRLAIGPDATTGEIYNELMNLGAKTLVNSLESLEKGNVTLIKQDDALACPAPKLYHDSCKIDSSVPSATIHNFIRGLSPKPTAWLNYKGIKYFFYKSKMTDIKSTGVPGTLIIRINKLYLSTIDHDLEILQIQAEGKRTMTQQEFVNGYKNNEAFK